MTFSTAFVPQVFSLSLPPQGCGVRSRSLSRACQSGCCSLGLDRSYCFRTERSRMTRTALNKNASWQDETNDVEPKSVSVFHQRTHQFRRWQFYSLRTPLASLWAHQKRQHRSSSCSQRSGRPQTRSCHFPEYEKETIWRYQHVKHAILQMLINPRTIREERERDTNNELKNQNWPHLLSS